MSHERRWRRWLSAILPALVLTALLAGPARAAYQASADSNQTAFRPPCVGFTDSLPGKMLTAAKAAYSGLGYATGAFSGTSFTKRHTLARTIDDWGYYVHSHGDYYYNPDGRRYSGFREDAGSCSQAIVYSKDIAAKRAGRESNLVVISTCHNGDSNTTLPAAFGIEKVKATGSAWNGPEFFLGYLGTAYDNDEWMFEQRFWDALASHHRVGEAFDIAYLGSFTHRDFRADWWGSYNGYGLPGPYNPPCPNCL
ncbi:MAG: hypothetical protein IVW53_04085 [Chloroflexi bacterium]|nr:hypothetical protein [Chloroflexota bacterium]